jgi:hypothetical protein
LVASRNQIEVEIIGAPAQLVGQGDGEQPAPTRLVNLCQDDFRNALFPDKIKYGVPEAETGEHDRLTAQLGRQPQGFGDPLLVFERGVIVRGFHVDREPLDPRGFGQAAGGPHQLPGGRTGIEANEQAAAGSPGLPSCGLGRRLVIHRLVVASSLSRLRLSLQYSGLMVRRRPRDRAVIWKHNRFLGMGQAGPASLPRLTQPDFNKQSTDRPWQW